MKTSLGLSREYQKSLHTSQEKVERTKSLLSNYKQKNTSYIHVGGTTIPSSKSKTSMGTFADRKTNKFQTQAKDYIFEQRTVVDANTTSGLASQLMNFSMQDVVSSNRAVTSNMDRLLASNQI